MRGSRPRRHGDTRASTCRSSAAGESPPPFALRPTWHVSRRVPGMPERCPDQSWETESESSRRPVLLGLTITLLLRRLTPPNPNPKEKARRPETRGRDRDDEHVGHPAPPHGASSALGAHGTADVSSRAARPMASKEMTTAAPSRVFIRPSPRGCIALSKWSGLRRLYECESVGVRSTSDDPPATFQHHQAAEEVRPQISCSRDLLDVDAMSATHPSPQSRRRYADLLRRVRVIATGLVHSVSERSAENSAHIRHSSVRGRCVSCMRHANVPRYAGVSNVRVRWLCFDLRLGRYRLPHPRGRG
jgi:hypothetical protein